MGGGGVRAVYFSTEGKIVFDKTTMGFNALGGGEGNNRNESKIKRYNHSPNVLFITQQMNQMK